MVLVKYWPFLHFSILGNIGEENVFYDSLERKTVFLGYKNKNFKKLRKWDFFKGVSPWICLKIGNFSIF